MNLLHRVYWLIIISLGMSMVCDSSSAQKYRVYVGTYTGGDSEGIYSFDFDSSTGATTPVKLVAEATNPSFLAVHPSGKYLFSVNETGEFDGQKSGGLTAFAVDPVSGELKSLNQVASGGGAPCHIVVDKTGKSLLTANYSGGNVCVNAIGSDGQLGQRTSLQQHKGSSANQQRQKEPHAHSINLDPQNHFAFVADLGTDEVVIYRFDSKTQILKPHAKTEVKPGSGPRHFSFHPSGKFAYLINELSNTITVFRYDAENGKLDTIQTISTLPEGYAGTSYTAEVLVHPSGKFVYGSNRGDDSIAVFSIADDGRLSLVEIESTGGKTPRNFGIDPTGHFLFAENQASDSIELFKIDSITGHLEPTGQTIEVATPVCIKFLPLSD